MAFDQSTRNRLQRFVTDARRTLEEEFTRQLQNDFGLDPISGTASPLESLRHINDQQRETARILRDTLAHYCAGADTDTKAGLDRIVREQAFTVLNRLAALRMAEARGLLMESVGNGYQAKGFQLYARLAGTGLGETGDAYRVYLQSVFDELSQDLPGLFDRFSPQGRLFPREAALVQVLTLINHAEIEPLWAEDETIGWIYQYFNSKEERKAMRDASQAPRNSRELAVRNQFFTPRYVVEFLVDNTLGRLWFNWTGGQISLRDRCQYLLVKPDEQLEPAKRLRDPRTIKLLDPACGSMHFGLYAFDLFLEIYREAWAWEQTHGPGCLDTNTGGSADLKPLSQTYADQDAFLHDVPRLIIEHNIYGVDIDPRAAQIASLALWLRAQRAWHEAGVKAKDRPQVGRGHVVAAVAPPAEVDLRERFMEELDPLDAKLFEKTLFLLKGLPELGVLLQVEKELPALVRAVFGEHGDLFRAEDLAQWQKAEARLQDALTEFARAARSNYQGRLFAEDALQGLRMIDHCREVFDVVVMNPPFGETSKFTQEYVSEKYQEWNGNILCAFLLRGHQLLSKDGKMGAIFDKTSLIKSTYQKFREACIFSPPVTSFICDLGWGVLDGAQVETAISIWEHGQKFTAIGSLSDLNQELRSDYLQNMAKSEHTNPSERSLIRIGLESLEIFPNKTIPFDTSKWIFDLIGRKSLISDQIGKAMVGCQIKSDVNFRKFWEIGERDEIGIGTIWSTMFNGGPFSPFLMPLRDIVRFGRDGDAIPFHKSNHLTNIDSQQSPGFGWGKRGDLVDATILPAGCVFTIEGQALPFPNEDLWPLAFLNSRAYWYLINQICGQHKYAGYVNVCPVPVFSDEEKEKLSRLAKGIIDLAYPFLLLDETCREFISPIAFGERKSFSKYYSTLKEKYEIACSQVEELYKEINAIVYNACQTTTDDIDKIIGFSSQMPALGDAMNLSLTADEIEKNLARDLVSYGVGLSFGRWSFEKSTTDAWQRRSNYRNLLPSRQPGRADVSLETKVILSTSGEDQKNIAWVSLNAIEQVFETSPNEDFEHILLRALGVTSLSEYFKDIAFFADHFEKYRKAPIYWPISTSSGSYTLWLYYPSLTDQTLFTAVNDFIEPKLKQVGQDVATLRGKGSARSREEEKSFEALQALELELIELRDTLLGIAQSYRPNHDDGVQITAAPLWQLFRHKPWQKILKDTWAKLEKGEYDWAHLAMAYWPDRVREKCETDKSLAIAHDLEHLYVEPEPKPTKARGRKKDG